MSRSRAALVFVLLALAAALPARDLRTLEIDGQRIRYEAVDGLAIAHGDLILGTLEEVETKSARARSAAVVVNALGMPLPWSNGVIYYTIDANIPNSNRVRDAIEHWNTRTSIRLEPRTGQLSYVQFMRASDAGRCASSVGMIGGRQFIDTGDDCDLTAMIHEIGHTAGLMHEMTRPDRNTYVTVLYENIDPDFADQFHTGSDTAARGYYDYDSVMHYSARAASADRGASMVTVPPGIPLGLNDGLSAGDIDAVQRLYGVTPSRTTVTTIPEGLPVIVDGSACVTPCSFDWGPGQLHSIAASPLQGTVPRYHFVRWTDGAAATHTITTSPDRTVFAAIYRAENQMVTSVASCNGTVTLDPVSTSGDGFYPLGTPLRITATPTGSQRFFQWTGDAFESTGAGRATASGILRLYSSADFRANFTGEPLTTITSNPPGRDVTVDGLTYLTPINFRWQPGSQHTIRASASGTNFSLLEQFSFNAWEDGNTSTQRTVTAGASGATYTASYRTRYYLSLNWFGGGFLVTTPASSDSYFTEGTDVTIEGITGGGRIVQYWLGDTAGGGNSKTLRMDGPRAAVAVFEQPAAFRAVNAASYLANPVYAEPATMIAPLEIVTIFGANIGPETLVPGAIGNDGLVATSVGGTRVLFDGVAAPILYAAAGQVAVVVPAGVASRQAVAIQIQRNGQLVATAVASVIPALPGIFTADSSGRGQIAIANTGAVERGSVIVIYASGAGLMDRSLTDGAVVGADLPRPLAPVSVRIGGQPADVLYAGGAPGLVHGALQVNVRVPELLLPGPQPIHLIVGDVASPPGTTVNVK